MCHFPRLLKQPEQKTRRDSFLHRLALCLHNSRYHFLRRIQRISVLVYLEAILELPHVHVLHFRNYKSSSEIHFTNRIRNRGQKSNKRLRQPIGYFRMGGLVIVCSGLQQTCHGLLSSDVHDPTPVRSSRDSESRPISQLAKKSNFGFSTFIYNGDSLHSNEHLFKH